MCTPDMLQSLTALLLNSKVPMAMSTDWQNQPRKRPNCPHLPHHQCPSPVDPLTGKRQRKKISKSRGWLLGKLIGANSKVSLSPGTLQAKTHPPIRGLPLFLPSPLPPSLPLPVFSGLLGAPACMCRCSSACRVCLRTSALAACLLAACCVKAGFTMIPRPLALQVLFGCLVGRRFRSPLMRHVDQRSPSI